MRTEIKRFAVSDSSDDDHGPELPANARATSISSSSLSDLPDDGAASSSSSDYHDNYDSERVGPLRPDLHHSPHQEATPEYRVPPVHTPARLLQGSPPERQDDLASSAFHDCYSPTATLGTSPVTALDMSGLRGPFDAPLPPPTALPEGARSAGAASSFPSLRKEAIDADSHSERVATASRDGDSSPLTPTAGELAAQKKGVLSSLFATQQRRRQRLAGAEPTANGPSTVTADSPPEGDTERSVSPLLPHHQSVDTLDVSGVSSAAPNDGSVRAVSAAREWAKHAESIAWVATRQTALDQLRTELAKTGEPKRRASNATSPAHQRTHQDEGLSPGQTPSRAGATTTTSVTGNSNTVAPDLSGLSQISPDKNREVPSILLEQPELLYTTPTQVMREVQTARKYDLSPPRKQLHCGAAGDQTPQHPLAGLALDSSSPGAAANAKASPLNHSSTLTPPGPWRLPSVPRSPRSSATTASVATHLPYHVRGVSTTFLEQQLQRREILKRQMEAKRMAECTFQPQVSVVSRSILISKARAAQARWEEIHAAREEAAPTAGGSGGSATTPRGNSCHTPRSTIEAPARVDGVYHRLYPPELAAAQEAKAAQRQEHAYRALAREEMAAIRAHLRTQVRAADGQRHNLSPFLSNMLRADCCGQTIPALSQAGVLVSTPYQSPMSVAMQEERGGNGGSLSLQGRERADSEDTDEQEYRIARFDEFLLRQNAYYFNRARAIKQIETYTTPGFKPVTTARSATLVKAMVQRSLLDETFDPEVTSMLQQDRSKGIPTSGKLVKKPRSGYQDPCTFSPKVSRLADKTRLSANGAKWNPVNTGPHLYKYAERIVKAREEASKEAAEQKLEGCSFAPQTNRKRNEHVESMLGPKRSAEYSRYLASNRDHAKERREAEQERLRVEAELHASGEGSVAETATEDLAECTFKPRTRRPPAYISKMASSFGLVRKMDIEF